VNSQIGKMKKILHLSQQDIEEEYKAKIIKVEVAGIKNFSFSLSVANSD
jgi:hypothetical protein